MKRKYIGIAILVCAIALTLSVVYTVQGGSWTIDDLVDWMETRGSVYITRTTRWTKWILAEVREIEAKLDDSIFGLEALNIDLDAIIDYTDEVEPYLKHTDFGLAAIDNEVEAIEAKLDNGTYGLAEIKSEVEAIETWLKVDGNVVQDLELDAAVTTITNAISSAQTAITNAISSAQTAIVGEINDNEAKIDAIEAKLDLGGSFYTFVNTWFTTIDGEVDAIETKLDLGGSFYTFVNDWFTTIDGEVDAIETKLDDTVIPALTEMETKLDAIKATLGIPADWPTSRQGYTNVPNALDKIGDVLDDVEDSVLLTLSRIGLWADDYDVMTSPTVFAYLGEILEELNDPGHGLAEIKREVSAIETKLDSGGTFWT
ncbi:MAG: hypothetical protein ACE5I5_14310, partial [Candidatus Heimdallarchaeota archaeon]